MRLEDDIICDFCSRSFIKHSLPYSMISGMSWNAIPNELPILKMVINLQEKYHFCSADCLEEYWELNPDFPIYELLSTRNPNGILQSWP